MTRLGGTPTPEPEPSVGLFSPIRARLEELRRHLEAEPDHMLTERAIQRRHIAGCKTAAQASKLITEYERKYGPGCVRRGKLEGGKIRVVCLDPVPRT